MRSKGKVIQVFEHQKLKYDADNGFKESHFDALVKFNEINNNKYFTPIFKGIKFGSYVGVIQIGGLTIEILPKVDKQATDSQVEKEKWQSVLLNMLSVCQKIKVDTVSETQLKRRYNSILEVYFEIYLNEVEQLIQRGLIKQYRKVNSNQKALKGKLLFAQNIRHNLIHKERFYCEHQVYDKQHLIHHIIFKGLKVIQNLVSPRLNDKLHRILFEMENFQEMNITAQHFERITLNRKSHFYTNALEIAKMFILNYSPSLHAGRESMLTLLFDMNVLWEEYVYRILQKYNQGYKVQAQKKKNFWENRNIKPDIIIIAPDNKRIVIDTKWKVADKHPTDSDLKQMFAYNLHWSANSVLLYPKVYQSDSGGKFHYPQDHEHNTCKMAFVDIFDNHTMKSHKKLAEEIFEKFL